jgi:hypothetical protein
MAKSNPKLLEREINLLFAKEFKKRGFFVLREVRCPPCELDLILLDPISLTLINVEIKRVNWKKLLQQSKRAQLYCHFSVAAMPERMRAFVPIEEFQSRGIGIIFYQEKGRKIELLPMLSPVRSSQTNRGLKQQIYGHFSKKLGARLYAEA